jgi:hypothetical protein
VPAARSHTAADIAQASRASAISNSIGKGRWGAA